jgi:asparagine synthase (glutamine-hydrolysing)
MCGIAGIVGIKEDVGLEHIVGMTDMVNYRGPDDFGFLTFNVATKSSTFFQQEDSVAGLENGVNVLLGHRRLSIIDLSVQGRCPMSWDDGRLWITYNGEVYNYIEIRAELESLGIHFRTNTDTEVILAAYDTWGVDCLHKFNGMWAFAILDTTHMTLFCARDRLGVKPFYYHCDGKRFSFGSEIKQLAWLPWTKKELHPGVLFDFITFNQYGCNSHETHWRDIFDMRGGHYMLVPLRATGWQPKPIKWWDLDLRRKIAGWTDQRYGEHYFDLFRDAVSLRLRSDVPVGSCLSGGLDSSGIVCTVDQLLHERGIVGLQKTFTASSEDRDFDETGFAKMVIEKSRLDPRYVQPTAERLIEELGALLRHQDEPFLSTSIFAGWCVYGLARQSGVTVTLDGQGPDEMLGGYVPYAFPSVLGDLLLGGQFGKGAREAIGLHANAALGYRDIATGVLRELMHGRVPRLMMPSLRAAKSLFGRDFFELGMGESVFLRQMEEEREENSRLGGTRFDRHLYRLTMRDTLPGILRQVDRNSMAFSIEARLPFLDYRLVEYTFNLPTEQRFHEGIAKVVYRRAMQGTLPEAVRRRLTKLGFVTAEPLWLRGRLGAAVGDSIQTLDRDSPFSREGVQSLWDRFLSGKTPFSPTLWKIYCTQVWREQNFLRR